MNTVFKMNRCAVCGSSDVKVENGLYKCRVCGSELDYGMSGADLERIQRAVLGGDTTAAQALRARYKNLDITTWSSADRLQN